MGSRAKDRWLHLDPAWLGMPLFPAGAISLLRQPVRLTEHTHPGFEITFVNKGEVAWRLGDGEVLRLAGGRLALTQPGVPHSGLLNIIQPCELFWIFVQPSAPKADFGTPFTIDELALLATNLTSAGNAVFAAPSYLSDLFGVLRSRLEHRESGADDALSVPAIRCLLCDMLLCAVGAMQAGARTDVSLPIREAMDCAQRHMDRKLSVGAMAKAAGLSQSQLHERFKRETGQTPADYLVRLRCKQARHALETTPTPITRIALDLGFSSSQYFAACFRRYTGLSPSAYRKRYGKRRERS